MNRPQVWSGEIPRSYDYLKGWRDAAIGIGFYACDSIGGSMNAEAFGTSPLLALDSTGVKGGLTTGLAGSATHGLAAVINGFDFINDISAFSFPIGPGAIYCFSAVDAIGNILSNGGSATGYGDIAADTAILVQECIAEGGQEVSLGISAPVAGSYTWFLVEAIPQQTNVTDADDPNFSASGGTAPNSAIVPYYNSANPQQPLAGPGGTNTPTSQQTSREPGVTIAVKTVTIASTVGTIPNTLAPDADAVPLYVGYAKNGDTAVLTSQLWIAGVGSCPTYTNTTAFPAAPFLHGLTEQHHLGIPGSAPKIDGSVEWAPQNKVYNDTLGTGSGTPQQIGHVAQGGFGALGGVALSGFLADAMTVGQLGAVPGPVSAGTPASAPAAYASTNVTLTAQGTGGAWSSIGTAGNGTQATLDLFNGAQIHENFNFSVTLSSALTFGDTYTLTATLPIEFQNTTAISLVGNVSDATTPGCSFTCSIVPVVVSSHVTQVKITFAVLGVATGSSDVLSFYVSAVGQ